MHRLVLASSSPFRRELLLRLGLEFESVSPQVDESPLANESAEQLARRLAQSKAQSVAENYKDAIIIGSDQVAMIGQEMIGKPGNHEKAMEQLRRASGQMMNFYTAICVLNAASGHTQLDLVPFSVMFHQLDDNTITNYLARERPYNCTGAFKSEGLGIALLEYMNGEDPTALIGLPLIRLTRMLELEGITIF